MEILVNFSYFLFIQIINFKNKISFKNLRLRGNQEGF